MNEVAQTLTLRGLSGEAIDAAMVEALTARGYRVIPPAPDRPVLVGKWEKPGKLAARLGIHPGSLRRMMDRPDCPKPAAENRSLHDRLVSLISTPALDAYLTLHKKGGAR